MRHAANVLITMKAGRRATPPLATQTNPRAAPESARRRVGGPSYQEGILRGITTRMRRARGGAILEDIVMQFVLFPPSNSIGPRQRTCGHTALRWLVRWIDLLQMFHRVSHKD